MLQTAAFDAGTVMFALAKFLYLEHGVSWKRFSTCYLVVPLFTFTTSLLWWKIKKPSLTDDGPEMSIETGNSSSKAVPARTFKGMLRSRSFIFLAAFASIHILKLNFFVSNVNGMTAEQSPRAAQLQNLFNIVLPFGFCVIPLGSWLLKRHTLLFFRTVSVFGIVYGILAVCMAYSGSEAIFYLQAVLAFPLVAISRQLVYSGIFYQIANNFGFEHFGKLLGTVNVAVAIISLAQSLLIEWVRLSGSYGLPNLALVLIVVPLLLFEGQLQQKRQNNPLALADECNSESAVCKTELFKVNKTEI